MIFANLAEEECRFVTDLVARLPPDSTLALGFGLPLPNSQTSPAGFLALILIPLTSSMLCSPAVSREYYFVYSLARARGRI